LSQAKQCSLRPPLSTHNSLKNMKILVTNPTGRIGRRIVPELLAPDFSVRVMVRDPALLPQEIRQQVEVVTGSADDAARLSRALEGVEAVFWCVPTESLQETNVEQHYERFACAGWQAIRQAGTPRVVTISAVGKGRARHAGPISGLHAMEEILNESGAAIRHLRCGLFMERFLPEAEWLFERGVLSYSMPGHIPVPMVAVADIADIAVKFLVRPDWSGIAGAAIHGPEDLSYGEAAAIMGRVLRRPVRYEQASATQYEQRLVREGASFEYARNLVEMHYELAQGIAHAEPRTPESTTRTTLAKWSARELLPSVQSLLEESASEGHSLPAADIWPSGSPAQPVQLGA
jgi:uncharacterized protein YbjT (DUF2867 family)